MDLLSVLVIGLQVITGVTALAKCHDDEYRDKVTQFCMRCSDLCDPLRDPTSACRLNCPNRGKKTASTTILHNSPNRSPDGQQVQKFPPTSLDHLVQLPEAIQENKSDVLHHHVTIALIAVFLLVVLVLVFVLVAYKVNLHKKLLRRRDNNDTNTNNNPGGEETRVVFRNPDVGPGEAEAVVLLPPELLPPNITEAAQHDYNDTSRSLLPSGSDSGSEVVQIEFTSGGTEPQPQGSCRSCSNSGGCSPPRYPMNRLSNSKDTGYNTGNGSRQPSGSSGNVSVVSRDTNPSEEELTPDGAACNLATTGPHANHTKFGKYPIGLQSDGLIGPNNRRLLDPQLGAPTDLSPEARFPEYYTDNGARVSSPSPEDKPDTVVKEVSDCA